MISRKNLKLLEKRMNQGLKNAEILAQEAQGNGHVTLTVKANGRVVTARGVSSTPNDWTHTGNKLRQQVQRLLKQ